MSVGKTGLIGNATFAKRLTVTLGQELHKSKKQVFREKTLNYQEIKPNPPFLRGERTKRLKSPYSPILRISTPRAILMDILNNEVKNPSLLFLSINEQSSNPNTSSLQCRFPLICEPSNESIPLLRHKSDSNNNSPNTKSI